jgi:UDP-2,3-diacylglucosamine hydrolase
LADGKKIYFISDVHLGAPALNNNREREKLFAQWLDFIKDDAAELYLLGDIFDFWFEYRKVVPRGFTRILGRLADMTDRGIPVHFFAGNHDLWVFDYLPGEVGLTIHPNEFITEIRGRKFYLAHGDGLDPEDKGYLILKKIFSSKTLQWIFARLHPNFALYIAHRWSKSSRLSKMERKKEFDVRNENMFKFAADYLEKERIDYFIFGHRHRMADLEIKNKARLILLGDWITNFSYGVFDGEKVTLEKFNGLGNS